MQKTFLIIFLFCTFNLFAQMRSFNDIFPNIDRSIQNTVFSNIGYYRIIKGESNPFLLGNSESSKIDSQITNRVITGKPQYLVEYLSVIRTPRAVNLIDIYNALGEIQRLNHTIDEEAVMNNAPPVFQEASRIESERQTRAIPDPPPARTLPAAESFHVRVRDANFGQLFLRTDMMIYGNGLRYSLTNSRNITFLFVPVVRRENLIAQLYIEPVSEGVLIYCIAGADVPVFLTSRLNIDNLIIRRLNFIVTWAVNGITSK